MSNMESVNHTWCIAQHKEAENEACRGHHLRSSKPLNNSFKLRISTKSTATPIPCDNPNFLLILRRLKCFFIKALIQLIFLEYLDVLTEEKVQLFCFHSFLILRKTQYMYDRPEDDQLSQKYVKGKT